MNALHTLPPHTVALLASLGVVDVSVDVAGAGRVFNCGGKYFAAFTVTEDAGAPLCKSLWFKTTGYKSIPLHNRKPGQSLGEEKRQMFFFGRVRFATKEDAAADGARRAARSVIRARYACGRCGGSGAYDGPGGVHGGGCFACSTTNGASNGDGVTAKGRALLVEHRL